ncbi:MAG TPA: VCBS repeat-containing protein, partial [Polyangiaceae bacterium]
MRTLALPILLFVGCSSGPVAPTGPQAGTVVDEGNYTLTVLAPATPTACDVHASAPSTFTDASAAFGLSNVAMSSFYSADLDHDGYPDLVLLTGSQKRGTVGSATPDVLVLMNRAAAGGGRTFVDETQQSGLFQTRDASTTETRVSDLVAFADVDGDGNLDAFSGINFDPANPVPDLNEIMINDGHGHFAFATASDPSSIVEPANYQAVYTDIDNDGALDLLTTYWYKPNSDVGSQQQLFHGNGDGTFSAITQNSGLMMNNTGSTQSLITGTNSRPSFGAMACDLDGDGYPEILVSSYGGESNLLYENDGSGNYERVAKGAFDGDTIVDYHDNEYFLCYCTAHASDAYCAGAAKPGIQCAQPVEQYWQVGFSDSPAMANGNNFSAACRDIDGDGKPDLFQGTIRHWWAGNATDPSQILLNKTTAGGGVTLARVDSQTSGITYPHLDPLGWNEGIQQTSLVDMDNDGRVDVLNGGSDYAYQYGHLFMQQPDGTFQDLAQQWGLIFPCMDGLAVADFDRDGDLDVVVRGSLFRDCATGW